jgi:hypothetical protein
MDELGVGGQVQEFYRLRQFQQWRGRKQHRIGHRDDGADRTGIIGVVVRDGLLSLLLSLDELSSCIRCGKGARSVRRDCDRPRQTGLNGGRRLGRDRVEMPERQYKLDRQRQQREPRSMSDVRPEPLHVDKRPASDGRGIPAIQCYIITSGMPGWCQPVSGCVYRYFVRPV